jgi:hypothetical protein
MPRRPPPITYRRAMDALADAYLSIVAMLDPKLNREQLNERLRLLRDRLRPVVGRDNGRAD